MNCKLTKPDGSTCNGFRSVVGETYRVEGPIVMCKSGIHYYRHPLLAAFFSPIHDMEGYTKLVLGDPGGEIIHTGQVKSDCSEWTTTGVGELPVLTTVQMVEVCIRCVLEVYDETGFVKWADGWLSGRNRSFRAEAAEAAGASLAALAAEAALAEAWAARAAAMAAEASPDLDVLAIIKSVVERGE